MTAKIKKKDAYEKFAGAFKNEAELEEELEEEDVAVANAEREHFEEDETPAVEAEDLDKK